MNDIDKAFTRLTELLKNEINNKCNPREIRIAYASYNTTLSYLWQGLEILIRDLKEDNTDE